MNRFWQAWPNLILITGASAGPGAKLPLGFCASSGFAWKVPPDPMRSELRRRVIQVLVIELGKTAASAEPEPAYLKWHITLVTFVEKIM